MGLTATPIAIALMFVGLCMAGVAITAQFYTATTGGNETSGGTE